jgi:dTDP-4-dehydrorhamnose reductase
VFGAGGQLGTALAHALPTEFGGEFLTRRQVDIRDSNAVREVIAGSNADIVINAAAYTNVESAEREPDEAAAVNSRAPEVLAMVCRDTGKRLIHVSTDFVFDGRASEPYDTDAVARPLNAYGRTKLEGERRVLAALPNACIVRTSWLYGRGRNFVTAILDKMRRQENVPVVMDQVGAPTWAGSLAPALWRAASVGIRGIHHWCDSGVASRYDLAVAIVEEACLLGVLDRSATVVPVRSSDYPSAVARPAYAVLSKCQTERELGMQAAHWRSNLRRMLGELPREGSA